MNLLIMLPLLPLAAAAWLAISPRFVPVAPVAGGWVVALCATFTIAVAALVAPDRLALPVLFVQGNAALVLEATARPALLLFGGLWLTAGLLLTRAQGDGPGAVMVLIALSGANTLALAHGGSLVYAGMVAVGYGFYGVIADEQGDAWRRAARAFIVLLVISDLLVFELILSASVKPTVIMPEGAGMPAGLLAIGLLALVLRGGIPPAHGWLPALLVAVSPATAVLAVAPVAAALFGTMKLLPDGAPVLAVGCLALSLAGAAWSLFAGLCQASARATLAYALAATAALLLLALPAGRGEGAQLAWLALALFGAAAGLPLVALQCAGWKRDLAVSAALLAHGLAGGHAAVHAASMLPAGAGLLGLLVAVAATLLLTLAARRSKPLSSADHATEAGYLAFAPVIFSAVGTGAAWGASWPGLGAAAAAPVGITAGLVAYRLLPASARMEPGDLLLAVERASASALRGGRVLCVNGLGGARDRLEARLLAMWDGRRWSERVRWLDLRLRAWPATCLFMLTLALFAALLLLQ